MSSEQLKKMKAKCWRGSTFFCSQDWMLWRSASSLEQNYNHNSSASWEDNSSSCPWGACLVATEELHTTHRNKHFSPSTMYTTSETDTVCTDVHKHTHYKSEALTVTHRRRYREHNLTLQVQEKLCYLKIQEKHKVWGEYLGFTLWRVVPGTQNLLRNSSLVRLKETQLHLGRH